MEFRDLFVRLGSFQNVFNFFMSQKLLVSCQQCSRCGSNMELIETTRVNNGYMWRCTNKWCRKRLSIRSGPFFEGFNIPLSTWLNLMFLWARQISGSKIARLTSLSKPTVICAPSKLRTICANKVLNEKSMINNEFYLINIWPICRPTPFCEKKQKPSIKSFNFWILWWK